MKNIKLVLIMLIVLTTINSCVKDENVYIEQEVVSGSVKLNELLSTGDPDWLELYNSSDNDIDLTGYKLADSGAEWDIPNGTIITSNGFLTFDCDKTDTGNHTNFKISASGERIVLYDPEGNITDEITLPDMNDDAGLTYGRTIDGGDEWLVSLPTKGSSNGSTENTGPILDATSIDGENFLYDDENEGDDLDSGSYTFEVSAIDPDGIGFVKIWLNVNGDISINEMAYNYANKIYQYTLELENNDVVEYYIYADDISGLRTYFPETAPEDPFIFMVKNKYIENVDAVILDSKILDIVEPSGLSYSPDKNSLYTVSDDGKLYEISFEGEIIKQFPYENLDFEGVAVNYATENIYVLEEDNRNIIELDPEGNKINSYEHIIEGSDNSGLEGITYDPTRDIFYILKEKKDGLLIKYSLTEGIISTTKLDFAEDYSGVYYNESTDNLWIVSDKSATLNQCTLDGEKVKGFNIEVDKSEGIVVNDDETIAWVVSDSDSFFYEISLEN